MAVAVVVANMTTLMTEMSFITLMLLVEWWRSRIRWLKAFIFQKLQRRVRALACLGVKRIASRLLCRHLRLLLLQKKLLQFHRVVKCVGVDAVEAVQCEVVAEAIPIWTQRQRAKDHHLPPHIEDQLPV
jgi:hypothetical protein